MIFIGIDPGLKGGLAAVSEAAQPLFVRKLPIIAGRVDVVTLAQVLGFYDMATVAIEMQNIRPQQQGARTTLANYGRLLATVELGQLPYKEVTPAVWNKACGIPAGLQGRAKKEASFEAATRIWGKAFSDLGVKATADGLAEALLIAWWWRQQQ